MHEQLGGKCLWDVQTVGRAMARGLASAIASTYTRINQNIVWATLLKDYVYDDFIEAYIDVLFALQNKHIHSKHS